MSFQPNATTKNLMKVVNSAFRGKVDVKFIGDHKAGFVRADQSQTVQDGKNIMIMVNDLSAPNYTVTHELLHLLMVLMGFPQVFFSLTTSHPKLDVSLKATGMELYDIVSHFVVVNEQRKHHLITPEIEKMYFKGVEASLNPETAKIDNEMEVRLSTLLDAMVFYGPKFKEYEADFHRQYPKSLAGAKKLYQEITKHPTDSPFNLRRNVVRLFKAYDTQLKTWELPPLENTAFTTLSSVLSTHQLQLQVHQVFNIYHSKLNSAQTGKRAYVGFNKADGQNSFVLPEPEDKKLQAGFVKHLYQMKVKDLFAKLKMPFIVR